MISCRSGLFAVLAVLGLSHGHGQDRDGSYLVKDAYVITMDARGDLATGDVLIRNGVIVAVDDELVAEDATLIDGAGKILLPGFVDTHTHLWLSPLRSLFGLSDETRAPELVAQYAPYFTPEDIHTGTLLGAAGNLDAGITTTVENANNIRKPEMAEAALRALAKSGTRAIFLYGGHEQMALRETIDIEHLRSLQADWDQWSNGGLIRLGMAWRSPDAVIDEGVHERAREELDVAEELGLLVSTHLGGVAAVRQLRSLITYEFLHEDMLLVHCTDATQAQLAEVEKVGASVSLTPITEHRVGYGISQLHHFDQHTSRLGLGIDGALAGAPDMFAVMRFVHNVQAGNRNNEHALSMRRVLELATIEGAEALGMSDTIGSITVGKRADIILVETFDVNMGPFLEDPCGLLIYAAQPRNVTLVMVDGVIVKQDRDLVTIDATALGNEAAQVLERLVQAVGE